ncbi:hypothetical protein [Oceaniferula spumae]
MSKDHLTVIEEPPGIPRGVAGTDSDGAQVELYIRRGAVPMSVKRDWKINAFLGHKVVGVARETEGGWVITGEVMLIRAQSVTPSQTKANKAAHTNLLPAPSRNLNDHSNP